MKGWILWILLLAGVFGDPLVIRVEEPGDTTTFRIPLAWMEVALDILKVLDKNRTDTSEVRINWDSLKAALSAFRGGFLEVQGESERVYLYLGTPEMRCPCLEITGKNPQERERVLMNLALAQNLLRNGEIKDLSAKERERLLKFLENPRPGEVMEIANTRGDTVLLRIVGQHRKP